ncbi:MAG TPA: nucleotide exchange factor GrpE [Solirubrobacteraceae bacterium]|jgi:molecular chaperone GrpE|nr:nucleotide exchange factor GrpE [Solirubrobacteraceae bacterium]
MNPDPTRAPKVDPQAPEAELPQAPPGAPEGHDAARRAQAIRPQPDPELQAEPATPAGEPSNLDELTARAQKADEYLALAQRTQADFENYRKRAVREAKAAQERGAVKLALELLPALDNLERALAHVDEAGNDGGGNGTASLVAGIKHVHSDVIAALGRAGIERYSPEGERFDPQLHEAVAQQPVEGAEPGVVVEVFQRGYRMGDNVVRPARVVVAG